MKNVLLVEHDCDLASQIESNIVSLANCKVIIVCNVENAILLLKKNKFDLIFIDLSKEDKRLDGIDFAHHVNFYSEIPIVFYGDKDDEIVAERMKVTSFIKFIKNIGNTEELQDTLNLAFNQFGHRKKENVIIKSIGGLTKLKIKDIVFILAAGSRCTIFYKSNTKIIHTVSMKSFVDFLQNENFVKTHRSYTVNIAHVEAVMGNEIELAYGKESTWKIPLSNRHKENLISKWSMC